MGGRTPAARKAKPAQLVTGKRKRAGSPAGSPLTRSVTRKAALNAQPSDSDDDDDDDDEDQPPAVPRGRVHANTNKTAGVFHPIFRLSQWLYLTHFQPAGSPQKRSKPIANGMSVCDCDWVDSYRALRCTQWPVQLTSVSRCVISSFSTTISLPLTLSLSCNY